MLLLRATSSEELLDAPLHLAAGVGKVQRRIERHYRVDARVALAAGAKQRHQVASGRTAHRRDAPSIEMILRGIVAHPLHRGLRIFPCCRKYIRGSQPVIDRETGHSLFRHVRCLAAQLLAVK